MKLFKYKSAQNPEFLKRDIETMKNDQVWFSSLQELNDPHEGTLGLLNIADASFILRNAQKKFAKDFRSVFPGGVLSLTQHNSNPVMWAHYAAEFNGFCIEYDLRETQIKGLTSEAIIEGFNVEYTDIPSAEESKPTLSNLTSILPKKFLREKAAQWSYEKEYRFVSNKSGLHKLDRNCISAIFLGNKCSNDAVSELNFLCKEKNIKLFRSRFIESSYDIEFDKIL